MKKIEVNNVGYVYVSKYQRVEALKAVTCSFVAGNYYAITGESGSGKSTLLSLLTGLDLPTSGSIVIDDMEIKDMDLDKYRLQEISVVYQSFQLLPLLTAVENVMFPMQLNKVSCQKAKERAIEYLLRVGIKKELHNHFPKMMSGGEQQRVAIARAIAGEGNIILADEPTGNLDSTNEKNIVELLCELKQEGYLIIVVTHNTYVARQADYVYEIKDGVLHVV